MAGWKTYLVSFLVILLGALSQVLAQTDWDKFLLDPKTALGAMGMAVVTIALRKWTQVTTVKQALYSDPPKPDPNAPPRG